MANKMAVIKFATRVVSPADRKHTNIGREDPLSNRRGRRQAPRGSKNRVFIRAIKPIDFRGNEKMNDIAMHSVVSVNKGIMSANMDNETVMMRVETGKYYSLGTMGSVLWSMLENPVSVHEIIDALLEKYQVERDQCEEEVLAFLNQAYQEGLLNLG